MILLDFGFVVGLLHVSYAPEYETVDDLKQKLAARKRDVRFRSRINRPNKKTWAAKLKSTFGVYLQKNIKMNSTVI